jgi:hypothetical protein
MGALSKRGEGRQGPPFQTWKAAHFFPRNHGGHCRRRNKMLQYGVGDVLIRPVGGNLASQSGPVRLCSVEDASVDFSQKLDKLMGQNKMPDDIAPGDMEIKGKATFSRINVATFNNVMFADKIAAGVKVVQVDEAAAVPDTPGPYVVTVANAAAFLNDLSVKDAVTGAFLQQVPAGQEAVGSYSVAESGANKGKYTFVAGDKKRALLFTYAYSNGTAGQTMTVNNQRSGYGPVIELYLRMPYQGENGLHLFACRCSKLSLPQKRGAYVKSDFEFEAFPNPAGQVFEFFEINPGA